MSFLKHKNHFLVAPYLDDAGLILYFLCKTQAFPFYLHVNTFKDDIELSIITFRFRLHWKIINLNYL